MVPAVAPLAIPNNICCAPIRWICDKIRAIAEAVFGYLLRITTFQLGEMKTRGAYYIMRIYQRLSSDPREERPYDPKRLEESKKLLIEFGGVEAFVQPADGKAKVHCMRFKSADFFNHLAQLGSRPIDIIHEGRRRRALTNPPEVVAKFRLPLIDIRMPDGTLVKGALLPEAPLPNARPRVIFDCHSPGRSMCMNRPKIARELLAGHDVVVWDPRGTAESTGEPSEGGYYLDAEAVFQHILAQGYLPNEIYVSGFCKGAACAAHIKKRYHHLGVHLIIGNPYTSMKDVVEGYGWIGRLASRYGLKAIQSTDPEITGRVQQDYFDNVAKLKDLPISEGQFILVHTNTDDMMPYGTVQKLIDAIGDAGPIHEILRVHPDRNINGHMEPPDQDERVQRRLYRLIK